MPAIGMAPSRFWNHQHDIWYHTQFAGGGDEILHFEGLATVAEVWLNGALLLRSDNMFLPHRIAVRTGAANDLHICFRSLAQWLARSGDRRGTGAVAPAAGLAIQPALRAHDIARAHAGLVPDRTSGRPMAADPARDTAETASA